MAVLKLVLGLSLAVEARSLRLSSTGESTDAVQGAEDASEATIAASAEAGRASPLGGTTSLRTRDARHHWPEGFPTQRFRVAILLVGRTLQATEPVTTTTTTTTTIRPLSMKHKEKSRAKRERRRRKKKTKNLDQWAVETQKNGTTAHSGTAVGDNASFAQRPPASVGPGPTNEDSGMLSDRPPPPPTDMAERHSGLPWYRQSRLPWYVPPEPDRGDNFDFTRGDLNWLLHTDFWPWASFLHYVHGPMSRLLGGPPAVFLCTKNVEGAMPPEITDSFDIEASDQFNRAHLCYRRVVEGERRYGRFDYYVKMRPDFVFTDFFPDITGMNPEYLHGRFREALGFAGLTSAHFSWWVCHTSCYGHSPYVHGYVNDDMLYVASSLIADKVFMNETLAWELRGSFHWPRTWIRVPPKNWETLFAKGVAARGILSAPIEVMGFPKNAHADHRISLGECLTKKVPKTQCGDPKPLEEAHAALRDTVETMRAGGWKRRKRGSFRSRHRIRHRDEGETWTPAEAEAAALR